VLGRWREYLGAPPDSERDRLVLYLAYLEASLRRALLRSSYTAPGQYLRRTITVRSAGSRFRVRPHSDDLEMVLPSHKPAVSRWFHPRPSDVVVDVGAHVGFFSILAARAGARVFAIEPNAALAQEIRGNAALNRMPSVEVLVRAAGASEGRGRLSFPERMPNFGSLLPVGRATQPLGSLRIAMQEVPVDSLDHLLSGVRADRVNWLLIDVEGSEPEVLRGATRTLERTEELLMEVWRGPSEPEMVARLKAAGLLVAERERQTERTEYWRAIRPGSETRFEPDPRRPSERRSPAP
jgi:FkbM family methyltransferase